MVKRNTCKFPHTEKLTIKAKEICGLRRASRGERPRIHQRTFTYNRTALARSALFVGASVWLRETPSNFDLSGSFMLIRRGGVSPPASNNLNSMLREGRPLPYNIHLPYKSPISRGTCDKKAHCVCSELFIMLRLRLPKYLFYIRGHRRSAKLRRQGAGVWLVFQGRTA